MMVVVEWVRFFLTDMPTALEQIAQALGPWFYILLFLIVFAETGLIVAPFLPGDSLLFAAGAVCALPGAGLNVVVLGAVLFLAALLGDSVNYTVGRFVTKRWLMKDQIPFVKKAHLDRTSAFFKTYGGRTIVIARFLPILRTYAPFVAGLTEMPRRRYFSFCVLGAAAWIPTFLGAGFLFGNQPGIRANFKYVILAIIVISALPALYQWIQSRRQAG